MVISDQQRHTEGLG